MDLAQIISYTLIGGLLPALFWLWFWLREDRAHPEPPKRILFAFIAGAAAVLLALPLQKITFDYLASPFVILLLWALIEEVVKFGAAYWAGLRTRAFDEPVDALVYLISAALGFAAIENIFFILSPALDGAGVLAVITGNVRFIGASLLHVISSASIGVGLAFAWRKRRLVKIFDFSLGLAVAVGLHTLFNLFIINIRGAGAILAFIFVWLSVVVLMALFEIIKRFSRRRKINH